MSAKRNWRNYSWEIEIEFELEGLGTGTWEEVECRAEFDWDDDQVWPVEVWYGEENVISKIDPKQLYWLGVQMADRLIRLAGEEEGEDRWNARNDC